MTQNHNYNTPEQGTLDWHIPLNNNFSALEKDVEVRDAESNRGQYTPHVGSKFYATDTGTEFIGDGESWVRVPSSGKNPTFDSVNAGEVRAKTFPNTASATVRNDNGTYIAFAQDGRVIDSDGSDAGAVIQAAIDYAQNMTFDWGFGGIVRIAGGEYTLQSTVTIKRNVGVWGIAPKKEAGHATYIDASNVSRAFEITERQYSIGGFQIDGGGNNVDLIWAKDGSKGLFGQMTLTDTTGHGMYLEDVADSRLIDVNLNDCGSQSNGTHGIHLLETSKATEIKCHRLTCINGGGAAVSSPDAATPLWLSVSGQTADITINEGQFKINKDANVPVINANAGLQMMGVILTSDGMSNAPALKFQGGGGRMWNCTFEKSREGIEFAGAKNARFTNCRIRHNEQDGVRCTSGGHRSEWIGCQFKDNGKSSPGTYTDLNLEGVDNVIVSGGRYESSDVRHAIKASRRGVHIIGPQLAAGNGLNFSGTASIYGANGWRVKDQGYSKFSGDGATTEFTIDHNLDEEAQRVMLVPESPDAAAPHWVASKTNSQVLIKFADSPPVGSENIQFSWQVWGENAV